MRFFETVFLEEAANFMSGLDEKTVRKVLYNIDLAEQTNDPRIFKKLQKDIWEFRTKYAGIQVRLLAFWDKNDHKKHWWLRRKVLLKKSIKFPSAKSIGAVRLRNNYLNRSK